GRRAAPARCGAGGKLLAQHSRSRRARPFRPDDQGRRELTNFAGPFRERIRTHEGCRPMKITKLTTYIVPPRWLFLKIETDEGIVGWGEPVVEGRALTVEAAVQELSDYLIGKDPLLIEDHWQVMYRGGFYRGGAVHMSALA